MGRIGGCMKDMWPPEDWITRKPWIKKNKYLENILWNFWIKGIIFGGLISGVHLSVGWSTVNWLQGGELWTDYMDGGDFFMEMDDLEWFWILGDRLV